MMEKQETTWKSTFLGEEMRMITYGTKGLPVLVFPTQDGKADQWEDFGMIDVLRPFLDAGAVKLYCVDSVDTESWSDQEGDKARRADRQERYFRYIVDEVRPRIKGRRKPVVTGCSMGANHTVNTILRRPDLFGGCIALSGVYDTGVFFGDWMNPTLYDNAPLAFLSHMPKDHPWVRKYNADRLIICVGQGAWEEEGVRTTRALQGLLEGLGVHAWFDYWGADVNHDWPWWKKQIVYFLPYLIDTTRRLP